MDNKWFMGIAGAVIVAWLTFVSTRVMALSEEAATTRVLLPRIEKKIDQLRCHTLGVDCQ